MRVTLFAFAATALCGMAVAQSPAPPPQEEPPFKIVVEDVPETAPTNAVPAVVAEQPDAEGPAWVHVSYRAGRLRRQIVDGQ